jgi:hypothetical protein
MDTSKLESKISSEQNAIDAVMKQIGEFYYSKYTEKGTADKGITGFCATIDAHNEIVGFIKITPNNTKNIDKNLETW